MSLVFTGTRADVFPYGVVHVILEAGQLKLADPIWHACWLIYCLWLLSWYKSGSEQFPQRLFQPEKLKIFPTGPVYKGCTPEFYSLFS